MAVLPFQSALGEAAKTAVCQALAGSSQFGGALVSAWQGVTGIQASPPDFAGIAKGLLCGAPSPPIPEGGSDPYGGANCECDRYRISYGIKRNQGRSTLTGTIIVYGPVAAITRRFTGGGVFTGINFVCRGPDGPGCLPGFVEVAGGAGSSGGDVIGYEIYAVQNLSNPGENCGVPPTDTPVPLPDDGITLPDVGFEFAPSIDVQSPIVNANLSVTLFQPFVNLDLQIVVPLNLNLDLSVGSINFSVGAEVNINTGDVNFNFGGGSGSAGGGGGTSTRPPSDCDDKDKPVRPAPPKPPSVPDKPEDPDIEEKTVISGVIVTVTSVTLTNRASIIAQGENPAIYAPALGFVNFYYEIGDSATPAWSADIPVKNLRQFIPCPYDEGAKSVAGTPNPGVTWELTPVTKVIRSQLPQDEE